MTEAHPVVVSGVGTSASNLRGWPEHTPRGSGLAGTRVRVWWDSDHKFYCGAVREYDLPSDTYHVEYDDGEWHWEALSQMTWSVEDAAAQGRKRAVIPRSRQLTYSDEMDDDDNDDAGNVAIVTAAAKRQKKSEAAQKSHRLAAQDSKALQKVKCCFLQQNGNYEAAALRSRNEPASEELKAARKLIRALKKELFGDRD